MIPKPDEMDEFWMREALAEARRSEELGEVPVGAVVVIGGRIVSRACNLRETGSDPTAHAEMIALQQAAGDTASWRLREATVYVTLEPCPMCAGAMVNARVGRLVYGAPDPKAGACGSLYNITEDGRLNHRVRTAGGVLAQECGALLREFFAKKRQEKVAPRPSEAP